MRARGRELVEACVAGGEQLCQVQRRVARLGGNAQECCYPERSSVVNPKQPTETLSARGLRPWKQGLLLL